MEEVTKGYACCLFFSLLWSQRGKHCPLGRGSERVGCLGPRCFLGLDAGRVEFWSLLPSTPALRLSEALTGTLQPKDPPRAAASLQERRAACRADGATWRRIGRDSPWELPQ